MRNFVRRSVMVLGCVGCAVLLAPAAGVAQSGARSSAQSAARTGAQKTTAAQTNWVSIGPIELQHGWRVTLTDTSCASRAPSHFSVTISRGNSTSYSEHIYAGKARPLCRLASSLGSGTLKVSWPKVLSLSVKLEKPAAAHNGGRAPLGCSGAPGRTRDAKAVGTIKLWLHSNIWGKLGIKQAPAAVFTSGTINCSAQRQPGNYNLATAWGYPAVALLASQNPRSGARAVYITEAGHDRLAAGVVGVFGLKLGTNSSVAITPPTALISGSRASTSGSLKFKGEPPCTATPASYSGTLSGSLTVTDPVLGHFTITGPKAESPTLQFGSTPPGVCDGPDYQPVSPAIANGCDVGGVCSVSSGTNKNVVFNDGTDAGTNTILSQTVDFGDGQTAAIAHGGSLTHTYTSPGNYKVTETITYSRGIVGWGPQTVSAATTAYIAS